MLENYVGISHHLNVVTFVIFNLVTARCRVTSILLRLRYYTFATMDNYSETSL